MRELFPTFRAVLRALLVYFSAGNSVLNQAGTFFFTKKKLGTNPFHSISIPFMANRAPDRAMTNLRDAAETRHPEGPRR